MKGLFSMVASIVILNICLICLSVSAEESNEAGILQTKEESITIEALREIGFENLKPEQLLDVPDSILNEATTKDAADYFKGKLPKELARKERILYAKLSGIDFNDAKTFPSSALFDIESIRLGGSAVQFSSSGEKNIKWAENKIVVNSNIELQSGTLTIIDNGLLFIDKESRLLYKDNEKTLDITTDAIPINIQFGYGCSVNCLSIRDGAVFADGDFSFEVVGRGIRYENGNVFQQLSFMGTEGSELFLQTSHAVFLLNSDGTLYSYNGVGGAGEEYPSEACKTEISGTGYSIYSITGLQMASNSKPCYVQTASVSTGRILEDLRGVEASCSSERCDIFLDNPGYKTLLGFIKIDLFDIIDHISKMSELTDYKDQITVLERNFKTALKSNGFKPDALSTSTVTIESGKISVVIRGKEMRIEVSCSRELTTAMNKLIIDKITAPS
ncbi:MAG: hypothetical protein QXK37_01550 [Candidatus Woesearchaeota archaeon]